LGWVETQGVVTSERTCLVGKSLWTGELIFQG
jgi:hypothetical protein